MADLSYTVEVKGTDDLDKFAGTVDKLTGVLKAGQGAGKSLEELRKILVGMKGQSSVLDDLRAAIVGLDSATTSLQKGFKSGFDSINRTLKAEFTELKAGVSMLSAQMGENAGKSFSKGFDDSLKTSTSKSKSALKAQVAEMQAAYEAELAKGVKFSGRDLFDFKSWGVDIGADARAGIRDGLLKDPKPIPVDTLLGLKTGQVKTTAAEYAKVFSSALDAELAHGRQQVSNFERLVGISKPDVQKSAKDSAAIYLQAFADETKRQKRSTMGASSMSVIDSNDAVYASAMSQMKAYYVEQEKVITGAGHLGTAFKSLSADGKGLHAMARGLASGFNALWLTWGQLAPLFIGAGISYGIKSIVTLGAEVQNTFETIRVLSVETAGAVAELNTQMLALSRSSQFAPKEVAEAMKTMSLAGLTAAQVGASIKDVLNFAVAGDTSIAKAADVMTSVATAFAVAAEGYNYVGDVIAKTAAVSKSSVDSIGESFKTASVLGKQYGVSLEDVGVGLAALSNLGIQGSAAGTALRNMYNDLSGRTPKVTKALKQLGLELRDQQGNFKDVVTIAMELDRALATLSSNVGKKDALQTLLSERGAKPVIEMLDKVRQSVTGTGAVVDKTWEETMASMETTTAETSVKVQNKLQELKKSIEDSAGFMAIAAAQMALTPLNQMKSVSASLQASIVESFNGLEPVIASVSDRLKSAFNSPEFMSGLQSLIGAAASLTIALSENLDMLVKIGAVIAAFTGFKLLAGGIVVAGEAILGLTGAMVGLWGALRGGALVLGGLTTGLAGAGAAATGFLAAARPILAILGPIGAALAVGTIAWQLYSASVAGASGKVEEFAGSNYGNALIKKLQDETARLKENTDAMLQNISVQELRDRKQSEGMQKGFEADNANSLTAALEKQAAAQKRLQDYEAKGKGTPFADTAQFQSGLRNLEDAYSKEFDSVSKLMTQQAKLRKDIQDNKNALAGEAKRGADVIKAQAAAKAATEAGRTGNLSLGGGAQGPKFEKIPLGSDGVLQGIKTRLDKEVAAYQSAYDNEKKLLDAKLDAEIMTRGEYQARMLQDTSIFEESTLQVLTSGLKNYEEAYDKSLRELQAKRDAAKTEQGRDTVDEAISKLNQARITEEQNVQTKIDKIRDDARTRELLATIKLQGEINKLLTAQKDFWAKDDRAIQRTKELSDLNELYRNVNKSVFSAGEAERAAAIETANATNAYIEQLAPLQKSLDLLEERNQALRDSIQLQYLTLDMGNPMANVAALGKTQKALAEGEAAATQLGIKIEKDTAEGLRRGAEKGSIAFQEVMRQKREQLISGLTDAVVTSLFEGGKAGGKKLRDFLQEELLRKPLTVLINGVLNSILGGTGNAVMSALGGGSGGGSSAMGIASNLQSIYSGFSGGGLAGGAASMASGTALQAGANAYLGTSIGLGSSSSAAAASAAAAAQGGTAAAGSGLAGAGSALAAAGPLAALLAVVAIGGEIMKATRGETRYGGRYAIADETGVTDPGTGYKSILEGHYAGSDSGSNTVQRFLGDLKTFNSSGGWGTQQDTYNQYNPTQAGQAYYVAGPSGKLSPAADKAMTDMLEGTKDGINALLKGVGSAATLTSFFGGFETSEKGRGGVLSGGTLSTGAAFGESGKGSAYTGDLYEKSSSQSPDYETALANYITDLKQVTLQALLAATDVPASIKAMIPSTSDAIEGMTSEAIDTLITQINELVTSVNTLQSTFAALPIKNLANLSFDAASALIKLSGSLETLTTNISDYYTSFYSESERLAASQSDLVKAFQILNLDMPGTLAGFRAMAEAQDLTTESGRATFNSLMGVAKAFAETRKALNQAAFDNLSAAVEREAKALQTSQTAAQDLLDTVSQVFDVLQSNLKELYNSLGTSTQNASQATQWITSALNAAKSTGLLPDANELSDAISNARGGLDSSNFATLLEQQRATGQLAGKLQELADIAGTQKTFQETQLEYFTKQLEDNAKLLETAQLQLDASNGIVASNMSVAQAMLEFQATLTTAILSFATVVAPTETNNIQAGNPLADAAAAAKAAAETGKGQVDLYSQYLNSQVGVSFGDRGSYQDWLNARAGSNSYAVGSPYIPNDQVAQVHKGERILTAVDNRTLTEAVLNNMGGAGSGDSALLSSILDRLDRIEANSRASAVSNAYVAKTMRDTNPEGDAINVKVVV